MAERDPFRILVNDLKEDLMKSVDALSNSSIQYMRNYGKELNEYLESPAMKKLLKEKAQEMSIPEIAKKIRKRLEKKFPQYATGKIPIEIKIW